MTSTSTSSSTTLSSDGDGDGDHDERVENGVMVALKCQHCDKLCRGGQGLYYHLRDVHRLTPSLSLLPTKKRHLINKGAVTANTETIASSKQRQHEHGHDKQRLVYQECYLCEPSCPCYSKQHFDAHMAKYHPTTNLTNVINITTINSITISNNASNSNSNNNSGSSRSSISTEGTVSGHDVTPITPSVIHESKSVARDVSSSSSSSSRSVVDGRVETLAPMDVTSTEMAKLTIHNDGHNKGYDKADTATLISSSSSSSLSLLSSSSSTLPIQLQQQQQLYRCELCDISFATHQLLTDHRLYPCSVNVM
jgi:hypothetical protein